MPAHMAHFDKGFDAIVEHTYSQAFGGNDVDSYSLYKINNGKIVDNLSWYEEHQLTPLGDHEYPDPEDMIESYHCDEF